MIFLIVPSISSAVFFAASAARCARLRTSSATTANPAPASPARAASTAAFSASRFVWNAISSIVLTIFPVSSPIAEISAIDVTSDRIEAFDFPTLAPARSTSDFASPALSAFRFVIADISSIAEDVSSSDAACSEEPSASPCDEEDN